MEPITTAVITVAGLVAKAVLQENQPPPEPKTKIVVIDNRITVNMRGRRVVRKVYAWEDGYEFAEARRKRDRVNA